MNLPRYRVHVWRSISGDSPDAYGIQVQVEKGQRFRHCSIVVRGIQRAMIYREAARAEAVCDALNKGEEIETRRGLTPLANRSKKGGAS
ncbi:MAG: hypothetical protein C0518_05420 [Opitutus sp.]|nr:hypothetical protein [Opitutus sp.]